MARPSSSEETRDSLLLKVSKGDSDSWSEFVSLYEPLLLSYVLNQGLPRHDANDVVQDVFIKLFRTLPNFKLDRQRGRFRTWLWQVTSTTVVDWWRKETKGDRIEQAARERLRTLSNPGKEPDAEWDQSYRQRVLDFVLEQVREKSQPRTWACFEQHVLEGRPSAEVGKELDLSPNSVNVNASRVLARVRELCLYYQEELPDE
jgi:RNA polymerase sigma-70 factor (ECF subfamily)